MKHLTLLFLILLSYSSYSQSNDITLLIEPDVKGAIYINEKTEFKCYLVNNSDEKYYVPARNLTEYPKSFADDDFDLFGPDGEEIFMRSAPGGSGSGVSHPAKVISENGGKVKSRSFFYTFSEPGKYKLVLKYHLDGKYKPANSSTAYKSFDARTEYEFEVVERTGIPLEIKAIDYETYKKEPAIKDLTLANDSTNVFNLSVSNLSNEQLIGVAGYKNLRGLSIFSTNLHQLPAEIYELDLFELWLNLRPEDASKPIDLSKLSNFKNLRKLSIVALGEVSIPQDLSGFEHLQELSLIGFKNAVTIEALPKAELSKLELRDLAGLNGIDGNFSDFQKLGRLSLGQIQNFEMPSKIIGKIWELDLNPGPFTQFPDMSELALTRVKFQSFTGESLPENFETALKPGAQVTFPRTMVKSKDYKKLKKAGYTVFPKS